MSEPTREQIAEALYNHRPVGVLVWPELPEWVQLVYFDQADAVLDVFREHRD